MVLHHQKSARYGGQLEDAGVHFKMAHQVETSLDSPWHHLITEPVLFQHPQIQKESQYIKYLCCDDTLTMDLWVTGIRIAKVKQSPAVWGRRSIL